MQTGLPSCPSVVMEGYLFRRSSTLAKAISIRTAGWKRRWFMIVDDKMVPSYVVIIKFRN